MKKILLPVLCFAAVAIGIAQLPAERQQEAQPRNMPASGRQRAPQYESVTVNDDGSVSLRIYAPKADTVMATGDLGFGVSLVKDEAGIWSGTVENVKPGAYRYAFTVDGVTVYDPNHTTFAERRPVTKVTRPGQDDFFMQKDVPHGAIAKAYYKSSTTGTTRRMHVWTPPGYGKGWKKLPVFYLIHGGGDNDASWPEIGCANDILDNLLAEDKIQPMVVVMPDGSISVEQFTEDMVNDIIPFVESNYKVKKKPKFRALAGLSMGGLEVLDIIVKHPDLFTYVNVMSSGWFANNPEALAENEKLVEAAAPVLKETLKYLKFTTGGESDIAYVNDIATKGFFEKYGVEFDTSEMEGGHTWHVWRYDLYNFAPVIFK